MGQWLASLQLQELEPLFAAEQISLDVVPKLTADDLKDLNVKLGPRKKLLAAIEEVKAALKASLSSSSSIVNMSNQSTAEFDGRSVSDGTDNGGGGGGGGAAAPAASVSKRSSRTSNRRRRNAPCSRAL